MPRPGPAPGALAFRRGRDTDTDAADRDRAFRSEQLSRTNGLELRPAGLAKITQKVDRPAIDHVVKFAKGLVRLQISTIFRPTRSALSTTAGEDRMRILAILE